MNEQINLRLPGALLKSARMKAKAKGFGTVQAYIEQTVRDDVYDDYELSPKEKELIARLLKSRGDPRLWATEEEYERVIAQARKKSGK